MAVEEMLKELPKVCDVGTKINSKGYKKSWSGYSYTLMQQMVISL